MDGFGAVRARHGLTSRERPFAGRLGTGPLVFPERFCKKGDLQRYIARYDSESATQIVEHIVSTASSLAMAPEMAEHESVGLGRAVTVIGRHMMSNLFVYLVSEETPS